MIFHSLSSHSHLINSLDRRAVIGKDDVFGENPLDQPTLGKSSANVRAITYCDLHKVGFMHKANFLIVFDACVNRSQERTSYMSLKCIQNL